jgi:hypothetical protein
MKEMWAPSALTTTQQWTYAIKTRIFCIVFAMVEIIFILLSIQKKKKFPPDPHIASLRWLQVNPRIVLRRVLRDKVSCEKMYIFIVRGRHQQRPCTTHSSWRQCRGGVLAPLPG